MLELARLFGSLFSTFQTRGLVNMIFLLTTGSAFNYLGADKWASEVEPGKDVLTFESCLAVSRAHVGSRYFITLADPRHHQLLIVCTQQAEDDVIQSLDFVLCLDSIGHGNELYFHASKKQKVISRACDARIFAFLSSVSIPHAGRADQWHLQRLFAKRQTIQHTANLRL